LFPFEEKKLKKVIKGIKKMYSEFIREYFKECTPLGVFINIIY